VQGIELAAAARVDLELVIGWGVVAAIAGIGDAAIEDVQQMRGAITA
jgi:hypothetical protein